MHWNHILSKKVKIVQYFSDTNIQNENAEFRTPAVAALPAVPALAAVVHLRAVPALPAVVGLSHS